VSKAVEEEVEALGLSVDRLAGEDRFATSAQAVAAGLARGGDPTKLLVATAAAFPDALSAAAVAARSGAPLLLVDSCDVARRGGTVEWLDAHTGLTDVTIVGGVNAVGDRVRWQFDQRLAD
jgi:putative cell wall-binding protein